VLLPLFEEDGATRLVLTRRPDTMADHSGQVVFPGGKIDPRTDRSARDAALREAHEEIGLTPDAVEVLAELPPVTTAVSSFAVVPFVGVTEGRPRLVPHPREVARVFDVALSELLADGVYHEERWDGRARTMLFFELADETIWGATARILAGFLAYLTGTP
jgi:8-oxo-dGTP pyrophosphatase MutT (NUDIX family)